MTQGNLDQLSGGVFKVSIKNYGWDRCDFKKLEDERNAKKKPKKERPINLILLEEFLKD